MILSLIAILLVGLVVYFHYIQGLFSAGLSAILAAVAAVVSLGYTEWVIAQVLGGRFADQAHSIVLVGLFAITYIVPRILFDKFVSGNVMFPLWVDRIGAGVMGFVAGVFAVGILMLATQMLPLGTSVAGFERFPVADVKSTILMTGKTQMQIAEYREVDHKAFVANQGSSLLLPVDEWVVAFVSHVSGENAALDAGRPFAKMHPGYVREIFGQRIGHQPAARKTALAGTNSIAGVYVADKLPQYDPERMGGGGADWGSRGKTREGGAVLAEFKQGAELRPEPEQMLLIVRTRFDSQNADEKSAFISFATGNIRLVANGKNYWPIGTVEAGRALFISHVDDPLFVTGGNTVDLAFQVDRADVLSNPNEKIDLKTGSDVFIEVKRLDRMDLGSKQIKPMAQASKDEKTGVVRKALVVPMVDGLRTAAGIPTVTANTNAGAGAAAAAPQSGAQAGAAGAMSFVRADPMTGLRFARGLNVGAADANERNGTAAWGSFALREGNFSKLQLDPVETVQRMEMGQPLVAQFAVPADMKMAQVIMRPDGGWGWASGLASYELVDGGDVRHKPVGFVAKLQKDNQTFLAARYDAQSAPDYAPSGDATNMTVTEVLLIFLVPATTNQVKTIDFNGSPVGQIGW